MSKVMGGWGIWETVNGEQKLTTECIENVIMMVPFSAVVIWNNWRIDVLCSYYSPRRKKGQQKEKKKEEWIK